MTASTDDKSLLLRIETLEQQLSSLRQERDRRAFAEARWQALMVESPFGIAVYRPDGSVKATSSGLRYLFGLSEEEDRHARAVYNILEDPQLAEKGLAEAVRQAFSGQPAKMPSVEYELRTPVEQEHVKKWLEGVFFPVLGDSGEVREVISIQIDVSELMTVQQELQRSQVVTSNQLRELDQLYDTEPVGLCLVDSELRFLRVNKKMAENNGRSAEQHLGRTIREVLPNVADGLEPLYKQVIESGEPLRNLELHGIAPADPDTVRDWLVNYYPVKGSDGSVVAVSSVVQEITEIKRTQEALEQSESRFRQIAEHIREVFWLIDAHTKEIIYMSPAYEQLTGRPLAEVNSDTNGWIASIHPHDLEIVNQGIAEVLESGGGVTTEHRVIHLNGDVRWVAVRTSAVANQEGETTRLTGIIEDITEQRHAEDERRRFETRFRQAQKLESLGLLAGGIAHDFNNLLMGVLGNADLALLNIAPESPGHEYVERIQDAAHRASELANQMLAYSGKGKFVVGNIDLNRVIREMRHPLEGVVSDDVQLLVDFADELPPVEADASQLRQVVTNLVTNASEAIDPEGGDVRISTSVVDADEGYLARCEIGAGLAPGSYVCVAVSDTGPGINDEIRRNIFDPFFTTKFTGRGLGLAATLGIVQSHGAALQVDSNSGQGATFSVLFPSTSAAIQAVSERPSKPALEDPQAATVLVVDDEAVVRDVACAMLQNAKYNVLLARDGAEAVEVFRNNSDTIDLVLLDMAMPGMDGRETYGHLRQIREDLLVVLSSGYTEEEAIAKLGSSGVVDFVHKPYRMDTLLKVVQRVLAG